MAEDPIVVWSQCLDIIKEMIPRQTYETWFTKTRGGSISQDVFTIQVPNQFFADWLEEHYIERIRQVLLRQLGREVMITFGIKEESKPPAQPPTRPTGYVAPPRPSGQKKPVGLENLYDDYTFDNFVVGDGNQLAHAASLAVVDSPGKSTFNPLVIYGGVGLGKTHLAQAIAQQSIRQGTVERIRYVSSEQFTQEFIHSIQEKKTKEFDQTYRNVDMLIVDDIQFFCRGNRDRTQEVFFYTFDALRQNGKQIVLTSDRIPQELSGLEERLISRFNWGLLADIRPPDYETRVAILQKKAEKDGLSINTEVISFIADQITSNIRELEGAVLSLLAHASLYRCDITTEVAREVLRKSFKRQQKEIGIEELQEAVAKHYGLSVELLSAKTRRAEVAQARQIAMYMCRQVTREALKKIGSRFGGRDHTTVIHACQAVEEMIDRDPSFQGVLDQILKSA
ncbi:MAG: chromosomal replication initiator protein DnaA [candidate division Zixibacteria bacterium]|nr:chromosomal replication initiator protein DnaA [candidate division Zixibacteria bacterium]